MKNLQFLVITTLLSAPSFSGFAQPAPTAPTNEARVANDLTAPSDLSYGESEILKLYQNGVGTAVVLGYAKNYQAKFQLSASHIIYFHNLGVPSEVILTMQQRDGQIQESPPVAAQVQSHSAPAPVLAPTIVVQPTPPPVVYAAPLAEPVYSYPVYPYYPYYYPGYYGPSIGIGIDFGPRFGYGGGFHGGFRGGGEFHGGRRR